MEPVAASPADEPGIRQLLSACGLPQEDITPEHLHHYWIFREKKQLIGVIGLEVLRPSALLRSLAIDPLFRNQGLGSQLTHQAENYAESLKIEALYLLTTTAEGFFAKRGYQKVLRESTPDQIQRTAEFRSMCPVTAVCMVKFIPS